MVTGHLKDLKFPAYWLSPSTPDVFASFNEGHFTFQKLKNEFSNLAVAE